MILNTMALAFLLIACTTPDPVPDTVVERVAAQTVEAPVTAALTATPPPATPTPAPTAMPMPTATPTPAHAATPIPRPTPVDLTNATSADAWIHVRNRSRGKLYVSIETEDEWPRGVFHVNVGGLDYVNPTPLFPGVFWALRWADLDSDRKPHTTVETVVVLMPLGGMRCERNAASTDEVSIFACAWR